MAEIKSITKPSQTLSIHSGEMEKLKMIEHFALSIDIELVQFCDRFQRIFEIPKMTYDYENETEWAEIESNGINYNVSRPYDIGKLREWNPAVPEKCNFGLGFGILKSKRALDKSEIDRIGRLLSSEFKTNVYYHTTWLASASNTNHNLIFKPIKP